jgi:hypothetical protein
MNFFAAAPQKYITVATRKNRALRPRTEATTSVVSGTENTPAAIVNTL